MPKEPDAVVADALPKPPFSGRGPADTNNAPATTEAGNRVGRKMHPKGGNRPEEVKSEVKTLAESAGMTEEKNLRKR